jgi:hypothetical protein
MFKSRSWLHFVLIAVIVLLVAVPAVAFAAPSEATGAAPTAISSDSPSAWGAECWVRVHWGDTLANIAWHHFTSVRFLAAVNHIHNPNRIFAGEWLRVPCDRR